MIRTVLGDIEPEALGRCDFHDHLIRSSGPEVMAADYYLQDSIPAACIEVESFMQAGGSAMVCMDPIGCGRDVPKMLELAKRYEGTFHIIMCTGFHKGSNYDNRGHWSVLYPADRSAKLIAKEVTEGMDLYSYAGPIVERCQAKAGIIKAGTSSQQITSFELGTLSIAANAQKLCGAPISIHTDMGTMGMEAIGVLKQSGANLEKTVLCHTNKLPDLRYYRSMLDTGVSLCFEGPDRPMWGTDSQLALNIFKLIELGYGRQLLLAMDAGRNTWQKGHMLQQGKIAKGIAYLLTDFVPLMQEIGIGEREINDMLIHNPAKMLSI